VDASGIDLPQLTDCTLYTIQFIAGVYHLHEGGYISKPLWMLWEREIENTLRGPLFQREWGGVAAEFANNRDFPQYINTLVHCTRGICPGCETSSQ